MIFLDILLVNADGKLLRQRIHCVLLLLNRVEWVFMEMGFHRNGFSSKRVFIKWLVH
jgi:hypothetical protein